LTLYLGYVTIVWCYVLGYGSAGGLVQGCKRSIFKKQKTNKSSAARVETIDLKKNKSSAMGMRGSCPPIHPPTPLYRGGPYPRYELQSTFNRAPLRQRNIRGPCPRALSEGIFVEKGTLKFVPRVRPAAVMHTLQEQRSSKQGENAFFSRF
jgi:hypothetical protein